MRHRDPSTGYWDYQSIPFEVQDTLLRVHFLDDGLTGWAVGQGGWVVKTTNGGATWNVWTRIPGSAAVNPPEDWAQLYDVFFTDDQHGWLVGRHQFLYTTNGGATVSDWTPVNLFKIEGGSSVSYNIELSFVQLYALDIATRPNGSVFGLCTGQPGVIFRSTDLVNWELVFDVQDVCGQGVLPSCADDICGDLEAHNGPWFEPWDLDISRHPTDKLSLVVGGVGNGCGIILATMDDGTTWTFEQHECTCQSGPPCTICAGNPFYEDDPNDPNDLNRHQYFRTLYGVGIFDGNNSAIAGGYHGQHVVRDSGSGVWQDRSVFATGAKTNPNSVIFPLHGAEALTLASSAKVGFVSGMGGHLRESTDGGQTWTDGLRGPNNKIIGQPHRIGDVAFTSTQEGWHVGQFSRIEKTDNGAHHWAGQAPDPQAGNPQLQAVALIQGANLQGVAVGEKFVPEGNTRSIPRIMVAANVSNPTGWQPINSISGVQSFLDNRYLREVDWADASNAWAVGLNGLIVRSIDSGQSWRQYVPPGDSGYASFDLFGVSFETLAHGVIVGVRPVSGVSLGAAYHLHDLGGGSTTWTQIALPSGLVIPRLTNVTVSGGVAWAVGEKELASGAREGVVLKSIQSGNTFGAFVEVPNTTTGMGFVQCTIGDDLAAEPDDQEPAILMDVAVDSLGRVWVAGKCGRVWFAPASGGAWTQIKSQTDGHIVGMSFVPNGASAIGFLGADRATDTHQSIICVE